MKLSELILKAQQSITEYGDIDVCVPCEGSSIDEDVTETMGYAITRTFGDPSVPVKYWKEEDFRTVFVVG